MASESRDLQLSAVMDDDFVEAQKQWQGGNKCILDAMRAMKYHDFETCKHAMIILKRLETAPDLKIGDVLWHASDSRAAPDTYVPLATSVSLEGAEAYAVNNIQDNKRVYHKLVVAELGVKALAIGADEYYRREQEMLLMMDAIIVTGDTEHVDGKVVVEYKVYPSE
jgi:hypothetical protein